MDESILITIKKMLGLEPDYSPFNTDIIIHINSVFMILRQLGVGPENGFSITGTDETWSDYLEDISLLEAVKSYIYLKVRIIFDPPSSSSVMDAMQKQIAEYEWRLNVQVDPGREAT